MVKAVGPHPGDTHLPFAEGPRVGLHRFCSSGDPLLVFMTITREILAFWGMHLAGKIQNNHRADRSHCYLVCDITDRIREYACDFSLIAAPDGLGYFGYNQNYGAYFEIISYTKLVSGARKRNAAFSDKLGLPARTSRASSSQTGSQEQQAGPMSESRSTANG
jgi:hypothetical protein